MKFKAFIFDFDGTLTDSLPNLANSINYCLQSQGYQTLSIEEVRQRVGNGIHQLVINSLPNKYQNNNKIIARSLEIMAEHYSRTWHENAVLYPGISEMLDKLMMKKIKIAVLSNKPQEFLNEFVKLLLSKWDFEIVIGGRSNYPLKPNPTSTLEIIKKLDISPDEVALVGDGDADIKTALAAGIKPIAVTWGFRTIEEQKEVGADIFINSPEELLSLI